MDFNLFEFPIIPKKLIVLFVIKSTTYKYTILLTEFKFRRQKKSVLQGKSGGENHE
jgi:hypothetical protein